MPVDVSIYGRLGGTAPVLKTPQEHAEAAADVRYKESLATVNEAKAQDEARQYQEQLTFARIMHDTQGDWERAEPLIKQHAPGLYPTYMEGLAKARKEHFASMNEELKVSKAEADIGFSLLGAAIAGGPQVYADLAPVIAKHLPELAQSGLPRDYNAETLKALLQAGTSAKDQLDRQEKALEGLMKGDFRYYAGLIASEDDPTERQEIREAFHAAGVPWSMLDALEQNPEAAAMTEHERQQAADRAATRDLTAQGHQVTMRGQDMTQATAIRGQNMTAETARRGQNMTDARERASAIATTGPGAMPADYATALDRVTINVPKARRDAIIALGNRLAASGDTEQLKQVIMQAAVETEPVDSRNQIVGRLQTAKALSDIKTELQKLRDMGVSTNILRGSAEDVARKLGTSTDTRLARIGTRIRDSFIQYRRSITGAAFSEQEAGEYERLSPNYSNTLPLNEAVIDGLLDSMESRDREFWNRKLGPKGSALVGAGPSETRSAAPPASGGSRGGSAWERFQRRRGQR